MRVIMMATSTMKIDNDDDDDDHDDDATIDCVCARVCTHRVRQ